MMILRKTAVFGLAAVMMSASIGLAAARPVHRHYHHYSRVDRGRAFNRGGDAAGAAIAGTALGLIGAGIAGAAAANSGYGFYGPDYGYYGPGYGYYGY